MGNESEEPKSKKERNETAGGVEPWCTGGPGVEQEGEGQVEHDLTREGPGHGVAEGGKVWTPTLKEQGSQDDPTPELSMRAGGPLALQHANGDNQYQKIDGIETGEACKPEPSRFVEGEGAIGVVIRGG